MKKLLLWVMIFLSIFLAKQIFAVQVLTIYQAEIPVETQSQSERNQVLSRALGDVLIKVSGNEHVLDNPRVNEQLERANALAQEFSYSPSNSTDEKPYILTIKFDENGVNRILRRASVHVWRANRPLILAWIEYDSPDVEAEIIDNDSTNTILKMLKSQAHARGLPIIFPTMDVEDINNVSIKDIVSMNVPILEEAAKRYKSDAILIARVFKLTDDYVTQAKLVQGNNEWDWHISGKTQSEIFEILIDNMTEKLTGRYAERASKKVEGHLTLKVTGILQEDDYLQLLHYIEHLVSVVSVEVVKITGTEVILNVNLRGTRDSFMQLLSLGNKLTPMPPFAVTGPESNENVVYQWNRH